MKMMCILTGCQRTAINITSPRHFSVVVGGVAVFCSPA